MRLGIDARCLSGPLTGIGRYVREILLNLDTLMPESEWFLYSRKPIEMPWPSKRWHAVIDENPVWRRLPGVLWVKWRLATLAAQNDLDVFWATASLSPRVDLPVVATVHDMNHLLVPETMPLINRIAYGRWFGRDVRGATQVVVNSRGTAQRLSNLLGRCADGIAIPGSRWRVMQSTFAETRVIEEPYILGVATKEPRKNLESLIVAFAQLKSSGALPRHSLVLVGATGWGRSVESPDGADEWLRELGYVEDSLMAGLYAHADLFVQPSIYEGFGMPAAEAASFGVRVVASDIPELREAAGTTGVFVKPTVEGLAEGIRIALAMPRPLPFQAGSWADAAEVMKVALESANQRRGKA